MLLGLFFFLSKYQSSERKPAYGVERASSAFHNHSCFCYIYVVEGSEWGLLLAGLSSLSLLAGLAGLSLLADLAAQQPPSLAARHILLQVGRALAQHFGVLLLQLLVQVEGMLLEFVADLADLAVWAELLPSCPAPGLRPHTQAALAESVFTLLLLLPLALRHHLLYTAK